MKSSLIFDILANRGHDALSHIGMAREICAVEETKIQPNIQCWRRPNIECWEVAN